MALLEVEDLRVGFDTRDGLVHAVDGVSLRVDRGRVLAIVGESGSGKTVTALTLLGLTRSPRTNIAGRAVFDGRDLLALSDDELRRVRGAEVAMIFQDPLSALHPLRRIETQLVEAVRAHRDVSRAAARDRAAELLGQVGIADVGARMRAYPHQLSGGMRQRVMIAMALVNDPRLLIADEPTTALDVTVQAQILDLLLGLRDARDMAIVLVTHDLGVVAETADDVAVMYGGRIVEQAPVKTLFDAPEHPYTWGLLRSLPGRDGAGELVPIPGAPPSLVHRPTGCHFHPRCAYVREAHTTTDPPLEATPGDASHTVRCLLPAATRRQLWAEQRPGAVAAREERP